MTHIEQRYDTAAAFTAANPVLHIGEAGHESDTGKWKLGDGTTAWVDLLYKAGVDSVAGKTGVVTLDIDDVADAAPLASPAFTGNPTGPTRPTADDSTSLATTEYVQNQGYATVESPAFTGVPTAPTPLDTDDDQVATVVYVRDLMLAMHPVGDIKMSTVNVNPSTYLGGVWVAWGSGRVPVGVDAAQSEFDTVEETGGAKTHTLTLAEIPNATGQVVAHSSRSSWWDPSGVFSESNSVGGYDGPELDGPETSLSTLEFNLGGGGGAHNNLQPYITCYMFKRTG